MEPTRRIWVGERDEATLTADIDPNSPLIVREIPKQLKTWFAHLPIHRKETTQ